MLAKVKGVLMSLCFILVFETVVAILTGILLLGFMVPKRTTMVS